MENNQSQNNQQNFVQQPQQTTPQQYAQPVQQNAQPPVYAPPKVKKNFSLDFLNGPDKNKFIFAGAARIATSVVLGILSVIYNLIIRNLYISAGSMVLSIYNVITAVVTLAIACGFGYMAYKEIKGTIKFAGVVTLSAFAGTIVSNILGAVIYLIIDLANLYGALVSVASFFLGVIAAVVSAVAAVALLAVVENKIDLSKLMPEKKPPVVNNFVGYGTPNMQGGSAYPQQPTYPVNNASAGFAQQNVPVQNPEGFSNIINN